MVTDLILGLVLGLFGCIAAFLPHSVFPAKGRKFADTRDESAFTLLVQFAGALFLFLSVEYLYPFLNWHL